MIDARRYEILEALGRGGFGTVYRARFLGEGGFVKDVALKLLNPDMDGIDEVARRLRDEARVLGLLRHRAIVQVDRLTRLQDTWAVVMEFVDGVDLKEILRAGPVPLGPALEIVAEVTGALHVAYTSRGPDDHPLRLLHRDIKPANIRLTPHGEVKVLDFGIARAEFGSREAETRSMAFGTLEYMSPERLDFQDGPAGDVYAVGVTLFEMLTGARFGKTSAQQHKHGPRLDEQLRVLASVPGMRDEVAELVRRMLAWDPAARPTAEGVEEEALRLRAAVSGEPLRFWARRVVAPLMDRSGPPEATASGPLTGSVLLELPEPEPTRGETAWVPGETPSVRERGGRTPLVPAETSGAGRVEAEATQPSLVQPRRRSRGWVWALLLLLLMVGVGVATWSPGEAPRVEEPPAERTEAAQLAEPEVVTAEVVEVPASELERPAVRAAVTEETPVVEPEVQEPPLGVEVRLEGDFDRARVYGDRGEYALPGRVPPGTWMLEVRFEGTERTWRREVTVEEGAVLAWRCDASIVHCVPGE
ncbi:MAG: protein kinase [Alphaproteobacteria bacterium]|nr:protein kinase [Alphaproteobacteria bacterium]